MRRCFQGRLAVRKLVVVVATALTAALATRAAGAAEPGEASPARWYGWQTLIALGASDAVFGAGLAMDKAGAAEVGDGFIALAVGGHLFAPPFVHLAQHHNVGLSFLLQLGAPILVGVPVAIVAGANEKCSGDCNSPASLNGIPIGFYAAGVTLLVANVVDLAAFSVAPGGDERRRPVSFVVAPLVGRGRAGLTIGGSF